MSKKIIRNTILSIAVIAGAVILSLSPSSASVRIPKANGTVTYTTNHVTVDASNTADGYIMVRYTGSAPRIKVRIQKDTQYTYDLNTAGNYETFPLTEGDGTYTVQIFENVSGTMYSTALSQTIQVKLSDPNSPFLYPNQFCKFTEQSEVVKTAASLTSASTDSLKKVEQIYNYTVNNITYDYEKAKTVQSGYLPDPDTTLKEKKGICFDYASLMCAMLRSQDIPTKLVIGYTGDIYHAWISVYSKEQGWIDNVIYFDGSAWKLMDPTFASSSKNSSSVQEYINNTGNYQAKFSY